MSSGGPPVDLLFEHAPCGLLLTDASGEIRRANATFHDWLGCPVGSLPGKRLQDLFTVGGRVFHQTHLAPLLQMQGSVAEVEIDLQHHDGHTVPVLLNIVRRRHGGEVTQEVAVMIVVDRHNYERELLGTRAQLREANDRLSGADRAKDEFLATLAHELRNPLAPMHNVLHILASMRLSDAKVDWCLEVLQRQVGQITHLVDDLLEISRITEGKLDLRRELVDMGGVIQAAAEAARPLIESSGHAFTLTVPAAPVWLDADPTRLVQVLQNLLNNAAKYTPRGGRIALVAERESDMVVIRVRDTGMGIPAHHLARVFEKFSQIESARERAQGGLGIGLALVRGLVELHGGGVHAASEGIGRGSEFVVRLPVAPAPAAAVAARPAEPEERPRKILVVDDNSDIVESLAMMLEMRGHEVRKAGEGADALAIASAFGPAVVLLDIGLPGMDGYEIARRMRAQPWAKDSLLVALTGWGQKQDKDEAIAAGFDHHLTKPLSISDLARILK